MQVEDVTGVCLASRRATQQKRYGAVGLCLLGEVIEDDENVLTFVHPVLANGRAGVRGKVLEAGGVGCRSGHDRGVFHGACVLKGTLHRSDGGTLLADGDVDATHLLVDIARFPVGLLVDDGVDGQSGFTGLAVTNDQLALATADGDHGVNCLDTGLHGLVHRLTLHDAGCLQLKGTTADSCNLAETIDGRTKRVNDTAEVAVTDGDRENFTRAGDLHTLNDASEFAEHDNTDLVFVEVLGQAQSAVRKLDELVGHHAGEALDVRNAVSGIRHVTDLSRCYAAGLVSLDEILERVADLIGADCEFCHHLPFSALGVQVLSVRGLAATRSLVFGRHKVNRQAEVGGR